MARDILISFYDPAASGLAPSALRAQLVNADGSPNGAQISTGFAQINGAADQFVWAGAVGDDFEGVVQFLTSGGRALGSSDLPVSANDNARAVWQYALESGADASAAIGYVEQAALAAATAANEARDAALQVPDAVWATLDENDHPLGQTLFETSVNALNAKIHAEQADDKLDNVAPKGDAMTLTPVAMNATADALLDRANGVDTGLTLRQTLRIVAAVLFGKAVVSGNHVNFLRRDGSTTAVSVDFSDTGNRPNSQIGSV